MPLSPELLELIGAVEILSATRFRLGRRVRELGGPRPMFTPSSPRRVAASTLEQAVTDELYCSWFARAGNSPPPLYDAMGHRDQLARLAQANTCSGVWEPGWRVRGVAGDGRVAVHGYDLTFVAMADEVRPEGETLAFGEPCRVRVPGEMRDLRPGFYSAVGNADPRDPATFPFLVRLYWHLRPAGAPVWLHTLTTGLNRRAVPFGLKVISNPAYYLRADAGVLYLEPDHYEAARPVIREAYRAVRSQLRTSVPALTQALAPGLGLAEGAANGSSFGGHRCALIAAALVESAGGAHGARGEAVAAAFRAAGLDAARPHLAPGSESRYPPLAVSDSESAPAQPTPAAGIAETADLLTAAARIGEALCRSAYRGRDRCNWIGRAFAPNPHGGGLVRAVGALGPGLYGGTAGIALFLGELHRRTGERQHRDTALAAMRQALKALAGERGLLRPVAFFEGELGVAWAARRVGALTGSEALTAEARALMSSVARGLPGEHHPDLLEGNAGAIVALVRVYEQDGDQAALDAALELGRELLSATPDRVPAGARLLPLTGFAHGTAGIGLALLELAAATGELEFRAAADRCFAYEEAFFDPARGNWPDLRGVVADQYGRPVGSPGFMTAWCHGAPGIGLSRLRAMELDPERAAAYEPAARAGLRTTVDALEADLEDPATDYCLCHGIAGHADIALIASRVLGEPELERRAVRTMERLGAMAVHDQAEPDPSLFTGSAGVGYALLRFDDPARLATVLLPGEVGSRPPRLASRRKRTSRGGREPAASGLESSTR